MAKYYTSDAVSKITIDSLQRELDKNETTLTEAVHKIGYLKYSKEGISNENMIEEWLKQVLAYKKAQAELIVLNKRKIHMDIPVSSIGTTRVKVDLYKGQVIGEIVVQVRPKG